MKQGWELKRLEQICTIARGGSPRPIKKFLTNDDDGVNWIKIGDTKLGGRYIYSTKEKIKPEGISRSRYVRSGSFLLSNSMSFGRPYILKTDGCIHDGWLVLEPDYDSVDQDYLYYVLSSKSVFDQFDRRAVGSTVRNLNSNSVKSVEIPLPPLDEQSRIVAVLDEAFERLDTARANAEGNLKNAEEMFESSLQLELGNIKPGWELKKLEEVCSIDKTKHDGTARIFVGLEDIESKTGTFIGTTSPKKMKSETFAFDKRHLLYGRLRAYLNKLITPSFQGHCSSEIFPLLPSVDLGRKYLFYWLSSDLVNARIDATSSGARMPRANMNEVLKFEIPLPPIEEQKRIVAILDEIRRETSSLKELYQIQLHNITELRQSLSQKAFAGELT